jgi:hypothetical protein
LSSTLIAHVDCKYRTRAELESIVTPPATESWKPVPHFDLVSTLIDELGRREIAVVAERYAVGGLEGAKLYGTIDLHIPGVDDEFVGTSLGLRTANDRTMKMSVIAAAHVFVCDNTAFSGSEGAVFLSKKHTSGLDIAEVIPPAIDLYLDKSGAWRADIDKMRECSLSDVRAKELIYDAFLGSRAKLPMHLLGDIHELYFDDEIQREKFEDRSLWSLNNAFTEAVKALKPVSQQKNGVEIGRYFGKVLHRIGYRSVGAGQYIPAKMLPGRVH